MVYRYIAISLLDAAIAAGRPADAKVPPDDLHQIRLAAPHDVPVRPKTARKLLVSFWTGGGYVHHSIPWGAAALRILGEKTGAYTATLSDDAAMFDRQRHSHEHRHGKQEHHDPVVVRFLSLWELTERARRSVPRAELGSRPGSNPRRQAATWRAAARL